MPRAFLSLIGLVTGYLNGAGLGALLLSFYPGASLPELQLLLIATLILGPVGAFVGIFVAQRNSFGFQQEGLSEEN